MMSHKVYMLSILLVSTHCSLSFDPDNYLEVYPDPRQTEELGRKPLYFALIQSLGGPDSQLDGSGTLAGVKVALDGINNDSSLLPGYSLHYTFANSKCNRTVSLSALHSQFFHEPTKLAVVGAGCSVATEPTAEISHFYNVTQISCVSSSVLLSNRIRFPSYFQLLATIEKTAIGYFGVIREYGWKRIAFIVQDENLWTVSVTRLKLLLDTTDVEYSERVFNTSAGISGIQDPFDENSRIFLLSMFSITALPVLCEAYHRRIKHPQYVLMTLGRFRNNWWRQEIEGLTCTADQRELVMTASLAFTENYFIDEERDADIVTTSGLTGKNFFAEERMYLGTPPLNITQFQYSQYCHDATWTLAYALNRTLNSLNNNETNREVAEAFNTTQPFRLEDFTYSNRKLMDIMVGHLSNTSFNGITGPVSFGNQGVRNLNTIIIFQFREKQNAATGSTYLETVEIGSVNEQFEFTYVDGESVDTVWQGKIPYDGVPRKEIVTIHPALTAFVVLFTCAGIVFAIACLIFNFTCRKAKLARMASNKLNYLIGIGAIILYVDLLFFVIPTTNPVVVNVFCNLTPWLTAIGYSLCYGTILAKMARVYYIFNNPSPNKKNASDVFLLMSVGALVAIDLSILVTYTLVEGIRGNLVAVEVAHRENPQSVQGEFGIITNNCVYICDSTARDIFLAILYGYKMLLQIIALVLAFAIRKVKIKGLDDAKYVGATIYVTSIVLAVTILATYSLKGVINGFAALFCTGFLAGTTVILALVFGPQMFGLYKDPTGDSIFERSTAVSTNVTVSVVKTTDSEASGLRLRIRELEDKVKELSDSVKQQDLLDPSIDEELDTKDS